MKQIGSGVVLLQLNSVTSPDVHLFTHLFTTNTSALFLWLIHIFTCLGLVLLFETLREYTGSRFKSIILNIHCWGWEETQNMKVFYELKVN